MRKLLLFLLLVVTLPVARSYGQGAAYYNFRDPLHSLAAYHSSVYVDSGATAFYTLAQCIDSSNIVSPGLAYFTYGVRLTKRRIADGVTLSDTVIQQGVRDTTLDQARDFLLYSNASKNEFTKLNDSAFLVLLTTLDTGGVRRMGLLAIDTNGRKLWLREYNKPSCIRPGEGIYASSLQKTPYGEWVILAQNTCNNFTSGRSYGDVVFMKLDSNFNLLWTKLFPVAADYNFTPACLLVEPDGYVAGIDVTKENYMDWTRPSIDHNQLLKVDTGGNRLWLWQSANREHEGLIKEVIRTPDSGYLYVCAGQGVLNQGGTPGASYTLHSMVQKLSASLQPQWRYVDTTSFYGFTRILPAPGGNGYYITGNNSGDIIVDNQGYGYHYRGGLLRLNDTGALLWKRRYGLDSVRMLTAVFYDMAFCGNGDVLLAGMSHDYQPNPPGNIQQGWIVKVDSNGCIGPTDPQCRPQAIEEPLLSRNEFPQVFPNPTTGLLKIGIGSEATLRIQDLTGRLVHEAALQAGVQETNLSSLPSGLYLYQIKTKEALFSGKIMKE